jgi:hypothetical protein
MSDCIYLLISRWLLTMLKTPIILETLSLFSPVLWLWENYFVFSATKTQHTLNQNVEYLFQMCSPSPKFVSLSHSSTSLPGPKLYFHL